MSSHSACARGPPWLGGASGGGRPRPRWLPSAKRGSRHWVSRRDPRRAYDGGNQISDIKVGSIKSILGQNLKFEVGIYTLHVSAYREKGQLQEELCI